MASSMMASSTSNVSVSFFHFSLDRRAQMRRNYTFTRAVSICIAAITVVPRCRAGGAISLGEKGVLIWQWAHLIDFGGAAAADALQLGVARAPDHHRVLVFTHPPRSRRLPLNLLLPCKTNASTTHSCCDSAVARSNAEHPRAEVEPFP